MHEEGAGYVEGDGKSSSWRQASIIGRIPTEEHQVTQQANGTVEAGYIIPDDQTSPHLYSHQDYGDSVTNRVSTDQWNHLTGGGFLYSEEEWEDLPPLVADEAVQDTINYNAKTYPYTAAEEEE